MWDCLADTYCLLAGYRREHVQTQWFSVRRWGVILLSMLLAMFLLGSASAQEEPPCTSDICYEETPEPPDEPNPPTEPDYLSNESPRQPPPVLWAGYMDGRLNPDPAEYYSIWCSDDLIRVRRVVPEPAEIKTISLISVIRYPVGFSLDVGDFMSVMRNTADTVTVYGSNGNGAPNPGEKAFSLDQCVENNGGSPVMPEIAALPGQNTQPDSEAGNGDSGVIPFECLDLTGLNFIRCVIENPDSGLEILFAWIFEICFPFTMVIPAGGLALRLRRRRK